MSIKNIVTGQLSKVTNYNPSTAQVDGVSTTGSITTTAGVIAPIVTATTISLGTGNLQISGNLISSVADTITIDPLGDGAPTGNLIVSGNMQVIGTLTYNNIVNATTNDLQWIAANNAVNQAAATGGGLSVGPSGAYAQLTYNSSANAWQSSLPIIANGGVNANGALSGATTGSFSGNVTAGYFVGDGSYLINLPPGDYSNANVTNYLPTYTGNLGNIDSITAANITATGNVTGDYFIGNGSQLTGLPASYSNSNVAAYLPTYTGNLGNIDTLTASGNITGDYFIGNGSQLTGMPVPSLIANGTSNVSIASAAGNIGLVVAGTSVGTISSSQLSLGANAASSGQLANSIAIGTDAGKLNQQANAIAIGLNSAPSSQGANSIAIGVNSGGVNQAANSVAIGANAQSAGGAVVINATGANVLGDNAGFYVAPIRNDLANIAQVVTYNTTSKELTYANTISIAGSITAGIDIVQGNVANTTSAKTRITSEFAFSYIQTGNGVAGSTGNIVFSPWGEPTQRVVINTSSGNITATGTIAATNIGNITPINLNGNSSSFLTGAGTWSSSTSVVPAFSVTGGASISVSVSYALYQVPFGTVEIDTNGWYSTGTNRYTPQRAGWYQINASARIYTGSGTSEGALYIRKNGTGVAAASSLGLINGGTSKLIYCNGTTDYIDVAISNQQTGTAPQDSNTTFNGFWVRA